MALVRIPPVLRPDAGGNSEVEVDATTVREALTMLVAEYPALDGRVLTEGELPQYLNVFIAAGYESVAEEDIVRLQWWGLYHDKPKIGTFMLRIKLPAGQLTPAKLRAIGEVSNGYGRGDGELATRQNIQLHWLELSRLPDVFAHLDRAGITTAGGCGDTVRNITGCPVQGLASDELFDSTPVVQAAADHFYWNPDFANLPRKHKYTIAA